MKTAMKILIEEINKQQNRCIELSKLDKTKSKEVDAILSATTLLKITAQNLLTEEKHQIIDFASKCQLVRDVDCDGNVTFCFDPKEYYDKTFS